MYNFIRIGLYIKTFLFDKKNYDVISRVCFQFSSLPMAQYLYIIIPISNDVIIKGGEVIIHNYYNIAL